MRLVIQRVTRASVEIEGKVAGQIGPGMMVLVGVETGDTEDDARWLAAKLLALRIFDDDHGVMNRSIVDVGGDVLSISQFTLTASTRKGNRPSYIRAARPEEAIPLYEYFNTLVSDGLGHLIPTGVFGADMQVSLTNDGPVTILIDSRLRE